MECTKEKGILFKLKDRTNKVRKIKKNDKFLQTILGIFISFSILNFLLIINFINLLEKITYMN